MVVNRSAKHTPEMSLKPRKPSQVTHRRWAKPLAKQMSPPKVLRHPLDGARMASSAPVERRQMDRRTQPATSAKTFHERWCGTVTLSRQADLSIPGTARSMDGCLTLRE